jgi:hypothetical protein
MAQNAYHLFLDESGNHGLTNLNDNSSVFLLCGVLFSAPHYQQFDIDVDNVKSHFWQTNEVILHSRDIRKCEKEFAILLDLDIKAEFYKKLNACISESKYVVFLSAIKKDLYIKRFGLLSNDVYELSLSFIIERAIFYLDSIYLPDIKLYIIIEQRGAKEDNKLREHFQRLMARGTGFVSAERLNRYKLEIMFKSKKANINGLQLSDLIAYPSARYVNEPKRANPAFEVFRQKIYSKKGKVYGLKIYP